MLEQPGGRWRREPGRLPRLGDARFGGGEHFVGEQQPEADHRVRPSEPGRRQGGGEIGRLVDDEVGTEAGSHVVDDRRCDRHPGSSEDVAEHEHAVAAAACRIPGIPTEHGGEGRLDERVQLVGRRTVDGEPLGGDGGVEGLARHELDVMAGVPTRPGHGHERMEVADPR